MADSPTTFNNNNPPNIPLPSIPGAETAGGTSTVGTVETLVGSVTNDVIADLEAGIAVFTALNDTVGANAYQAVLAQLQAIQKATAASNLPKVHVAYDAAVLRALILAVQPNSPVMNAVAPLAAQMGQQVLTLVNSIVTGVAIKVGTAGVL